MTTPNGRHPKLEGTYPADEPAPFASREEAIERLAPSRATILLVGGSSLEKSSAAQALHCRSPHAHGPFIAVDCAVAATSQLDEILFGEPLYGVTSRRPGQNAPQAAIQDAERGTLYVATIDMLPMPLQPRFLHFLDEASSVRVLVSSDRSLGALARHGRFRADLAERLSLVCVDLSNLRRLVP